MKELENIKPDKVEIVNQRQVEYEKKFLGSTVRHNGHTMWEINCGTGSVVPAEFAEERVELVPIVDLITGEKRGVTNQVVREIITKENCVYIAALNKKSAVKKYLKFLIEKQKEAKQ